MTRAFSRAHDAVGRLAQALALLVRHVTAAGELAVLPKPSITADTAATRAEAVASTDLSVQILALPVVTLTVLAVHTFISRWVTCALTTQTLPSAKAGQAGGSPTPLLTGFHRQRTGEGMIAFPSSPAFLAVAPATVTLAVT